jgi:hypothetical protein
MEVTMNDWQRVRDLFAHIGIAVALRYAMQTIADTYKTNITFPLALPPYPGNLIVRPPLHLV